MNIRLKRFLASVVVAPAAALALWAVAVGVFGVSLVAGAEDARIHIGPWAVVIASVLVGLAAWALLAVLERLTAKSGRIWTITAVIVLALSVPLGPLGAESTAAVVVLVLMHMVVAAVLIPGLRR
ncbi:DUF6069 family protein [Glycomyces tarimensis]